MKQNNSKKQSYAAVFVSGDIGRSPRMQNHAYEIIEQTDYNVLMMGYSQSKMHDKLALNKRISLYNFQKTFTFMKFGQQKFPRALYFIFRIIIETISIFYSFFFDLQHKLDFIIVQNPPSIPVLFALYICCKLKGIYFIVDFHNYGYSILELTLKQKIIIKFAKFIEFYFGKKADFSFCVSKAMQQDLQDKYKIKCEVLYDRANTNQFMKLDQNEKQKQLQQLGVLEQESNKKTIYIISSTSWTPDEDFSILLDALQQYEQLCKTDKSIRNPPLLSVFITGKGPLKEEFKQEIEKKQDNWQHIKIRLMWLKAEEYPLLLGACDIGVCLHSSSSGLDLPMKVIDMFGCQLPVMALYYQSIHELVHNYNGWIFKDSQQLSLLFLKVFTNINQQSLEDKSQHIKKWRDHSFHMEWKQKALPFIQQLSTQKKTQYFNYSRQIIQLFLLILIYQSFRFIQSFLNY